MGTDLLSFGFCNSAAHFAKLREDDLRIDFKASTPGIGNREYASVHRQMSSFYNLRLDGLQQSLMATHIQLVSLT
jgi:hypothetical protein